MTAARGSRHQQHSSASGSTGLALWLRKGSAVFVPRRSLGSGRRGADQTHPVVPGLDSGGTVRQIHAASCMDWQCDVATKLPTSSFTHIAAAAVAMPTGQRTYTTSLPLSPPPPPSDLGSYARFMHQHTKRQLESISQAAPRGSPHVPSPPAGLPPDGVAGRGRNANHYAYHHQS
ncbi:hypothetical protein VTH06DRAFT_5978 [Thermothelomyces fergusii]